jgi:hypothetical protein
MNDLDDLSGVNCEDDSSGQLAKSKLSLLMGLALGAGLGFLGGMLVGKRKGEALGWPWAWNSVAPKPLPQWRPLAPGEDSGGEKPPYKTRRQRSAPPHRAWSKACPRASPTRTATRPRQEGAAAPATTGMPRVRFFQ